MNTSRSLSVVRLLTSIVAVWLLVGCQHRTSYRASTGNNEPGYTSWQESGAVFHVIYRGAPGTSLRDVRDLALLRAAEIARDAGRREFVILAEHSAVRTETVQHRTAPPESPLVGSNAAGGQSAEQTEAANRARSLIQRSLPARLEFPVVEMKISTEPEPSHRAMDSSAPYAVETLLRDIPAKYGLTLAART